MKHPGLDMVTVDELQTIAKILREEQYSKAADKIDQTILELRDLRSQLDEKTPKADRPFTAATRH